MTNPFASAGLSDASLRPLMQGKVLNRSQAAACIVWGSVLWFLAAQFARHTIPLGLYEGAAFVWLLVLTAPAAAGLVWSIGMVGRVGRDRIVAGVALAGAAATMLDGLAFGFLPDLYSADPDHVLRAAAWILWGVGAGQFIAQGVAWAASGRRA